MRDQYILLECSKVHEKLDGYVFSLVFFDVTAPSSLFGERFSLVFFNVTAVINQHSSLIIRHSSFVIHHSYINQQAIKNRSKINQKSSQNPTKIGPGAVLELTWSTFRSEIDILTDFEAAWWPTWLHLGSQHEPQSEKFSKIL